MKFHWPYFSYNFFTYNANFLLLGASKQKRAPWVSFYGQMYAYLRGEYTYFSYQNLWINYLKKIRLIGRLQSDPRNNFFFITNRLEHIRFLNEHSRAVGANTIFFERAAQFSIKCGRSDMADIMDNKMRSLGASNNTFNSLGYRQALSKIFILIANNSFNDNIFLKNLAAAERQFMTFSPADTYSLYTEVFVPIFGNNFSRASWLFYLNLFKKSKPRARVSFGVGVFRAGSSVRPDRRLYKRAQDPHILQGLKPRVARSLRAHSRLVKNFTPSGTSFKYNTESGLFQSAQLLPRCRAASLSREFY